jgi:hypothetical protein
MKLLTEDRTWRRARVHFWLYVDRDVIEHLFALVREGAFGEIARAQGYSQDRRGRPVSICYEDERLEWICPAPDVAAEAGRLEIEGRFTGADLIQMRNHTAFHLRGFFRQTLGRTKTPKEWPPPQEPRPGGR